jgi:F-type H+-transporting ATPase subunit a
MLNPLLCLIELVRNLVRPITLAVRLTANLTTGHILIGLAGTAFNTSSLFILILIIGSFYFLFEMAVCIIQAYIFTLLPTLYTNDYWSI